MARRREGPLRPLADWDDDHSAPAGIYWWSRLDERFQVEARRLPARKALLVAFDRANDDALIGRVVIEMIGDPRYGPDPDDIYGWQRIAEWWVSTRPLDDGASPDPGIDDPEVEPR